MRQHLSRNTSPEFFGRNCLQFIKDQKFQFKSFMAAYKFYNQYALKTNDGEYYLESMEDRVFFNALYFADGNEAVAIDIANEIIHQRYQPATPSFLNAGRARRGELVSCFLIQVTDDYELYRTFYQLSSSTFTYWWWCGNYSQQPS